MPANRGFVIYLSAWPFDIGKKPRFFTFQQDVFLNNKIALFIFIILKSCQTFFFLQNLVMRMSEQMS